MTRKKYVLSLIMLSCAIALAIICFTGNFARVQSQSVQSENLTEIISNRRRPPLAERGRPGNRTGGGTRTCGFEESFAILVPEFEESGNTYILESTLEEYLNLWLYVPVLPEKMQSTAEVLLFNDKEAEDKPPIYQGSFTLPETSGIVRVKIPYRLDPHNIYMWRLNISIKSDAYCTESSAYESTDSEVIQMYGSAKRVEHREFQTNFDSVKGLDLVNHYVDAKIWNDALTTLAELRIENPNNTQINDAWINLLKSLNWDREIEKDIINANIIPDCCSVVQ